MFGWLPVLMTAYNSSIQLVTCTENTVTDKNCIPVAERSNARVCGRSPAGIAGSNPAGGMDVCCVVVCYQVEVSAEG